VLTILLTVMMGMTLTMLTPVITVIKPMIVRGQNCSDSPHHVHRGCAQPHLWPR